MRESLEETAAQVPDLTMFGATFNLTPCLQRLAELQSLRATNLSVRDFGVAVPPRDQLNEELSMQDLVGDQPSSQRPSWWSSRGRVSPLLPFKRPSQSAALSSVQEEGDGSRVSPSGSFRHSRRLSWTGGRRRSSHRRRPGTMDFPPEEQDEETSADKHDNIDKSYPIEPDEPTLGSELPMLPIIIVTSSEAESC
jgi:hypothetical protein